MVRFIIVLLQVMSLLFFNAIFDGDVDIHLNAPAQINAGSEIAVNITLKKGKLNGFSRFQMELPNGLTAVNVHSANADFSFKDQKVRFIWLRMPEDETLTISFTILCNERLKGNFDLSGKFSYIDNNERKSVDIQSQSVAIVPSSTIDPGLIVDIRDFGKSIYQFPGSGGGEVVCIRQKPEYNSNGEYIVNLLVNKEGLKKFAKIEEIIPKGFTALNLNSKEGIFTFRDGKAKYLWMNLPTEPYFTISYKLLPVNTESAPLITGTFSYMDEEKTRSLPIIEKDVSMVNLTPETVKSILLAPSVMIAAITPTSTGTGIKGNETTTQTAVTEGKQTTTTEVKQPIADLKQNTNIAPRESTYVKQNVGIKQSDKQVETPTVIDNSDLLDPQSGISFRVQIAAGHRPVNIKRYFKKYKLDNSVIKEQHDGWIKYSVGSFDIYKDARDYRIHVWNTTTITDAFVSAYNEGKRITVQEALMVANQKWYK